MAGFPLQNLTVDVSTTPSGGIGTGGAFDLSEFETVSVAGHVDNYTPNQTGLTIILQFQLEDGTFENYQTIATVGNGSANIPEQTFNAPFQAARISWNVGSAGGATGTFEVSVWGEK